MITIGLKLDIPFVKSYDYKIALMTAQLYMRIVCQHDSCFINLSIIKNYQEATPAFCS